ncbi:solute carrier family 25 member 35 isoform X4 [Erpetoichthys calabaricus]|uniref:solute carrier family 25 member 35 isoform X4 n=1 Tax=Erpetoichthys calabaricus TaxID=27687 RepID=UPI00109F5DE9|nr:solute carrier family 25 member 35 isoform X4 [Erpetoichthys calabaricus]
MDFVLSGVSACCACLFTNPLEVVKTRMQLQGEMMTPGSYKIHYRNVLHAFYTIGKVDGLAGLQKGLVPALNYQLVMNGVRLGSYAILETGGYIHSGGRVSPVKSVAAGAVAGVLGAIIGSPMYLVKTHLQSQSTASIAVGHQYQHQVFPLNSWLVSLSAGMISSVFVVLGMTPFDVISTRLYNQPIDSRGKGLLYSGFISCFSQTIRKEGIFGLYKGIGASYFRLGPHTILSLLFWNELRKVYYKDRQLASRPR